MTKSEGRFMPPRPRQVKKERTRLRAEIQRVSGQAAAAKSPFLIGKLNERLSVLRAELAALN